MEPKTCSKCRVEKPRDQFSRKTRNRDGLSDTCKECNAAYLRAWAAANRDRKRQMDRDYAAANREQARARARAWAAANRERKRQTDRNYAAANQERISEQSATYREKNKDRIRQNKARYAEENKEAIRQRRKEWRQANHGKVLANVTLRKMKKRNATPPWLTKEHRLQMRWAYELAEILTATMGEPYHVDHIFPISHPRSCGLHVPWNLQVIPARDNLKKGNTLPDA